GGREGQQNGRPDGLDRVGLGDDLYVGQVVRKVVRVVIPGREREGDAQRPKALGDAKSLFRAEVYVDEGQVWRLCCDELEGQMHAVRRAHLRAADLPQHVLQIDRNDVLVLDEQDIARHEAGSADGRARRRRM